MFAVVDETVVAVTRALSTPAPQTARMLFFSLSQSLQYVNGVELRSLVENNVEVLPVKTLVDRVGCVALAAAEAARIGKTIVYIRLYTQILPAAPTVARELEYVI